MRLLPQVSGTGPFQYLWTPAPPPDWLSCYDRPDPLATPLADIILKVQVNDANGCGAAVVLSLRVLSSDEPYIPNAFTPNGDGVNDWFYIFGPECIRQIRLLRLYSRWGELVFERYNFPANQSNLGWDGRLRGKDFPTDVLVFYAEIEMPDGTILVRSGDVTLIR